MISSHAVWLGLFAMLPLGLSSFVNSTYYNPILPGWHSDPSCIFVPEEGNTFFCATSTFLVTPGIPIYASKDLINWKLVSHALSRSSQVPYMNESTDQNDGIFAPTLRYHKGVFYVITVYVFRTGGGVRGLIFNTTDPYSNSAWSEPVKYNSDGIDPDLFWDDDGTAYLTSTDITQRTIDPKTGITGTPHKIWNGTGGAYPEGPHIYKKDEYYYLMIGEGGTELNHSVTIARSRNIDGPYESYVGNPILTARGTSEYFQTVGHADLFQDAAGNWWGAALATRSGPEWKTYPMGRESILTPVTWKAGEWPIMETVRGKMSGWHLPPRNRKIRGSGPFLGDPDAVDFAPGSSLPPHFVTWRWPAAGSFSISPRGHPFTLGLKPSRTITQADDDLNAGADGLSLIMRLQTDTLFTFSVDVDFDPESPEEEVGVTVFLTQRQHIDLGIVMLPSTGSSSKLEPQLRLRSTFVGSTEGALPLTTINAIPRAWLKKPITLQIQAKNDTHYTFSAASSINRKKSVNVGSAPGIIVSGGSGPFTGSLVGIYATINNGAGTTESYISRWRYKGDGQKIDHNVVVPSRT